MARARTSSTAQAATPARARRPRGIQIERTRFKSLLLQNPNYFGNLEDSATFKPVKVITGQHALSSRWSASDCIRRTTGSRPSCRSSRRSGYGGDICAGSREYVRFYVDLFDNGVWHDVGVSSVRVYDIPGEKPHLLCRSPRLQLVQEVLPLRKHRQGPRDPAVERAAAGQFAQLHRRCGATSSTCRCRSARSSSSRGAISLKEFETDPHQVSRSRSGRSSRVLDPAVKLTALEAPPLTVAQKTGAVQGQRRARASLRVPGSAAAPGAAESDRARRARQIAARRAGADAGQHRRSRRQAVSDRRRHQLRGAAVRGLYPGGRSD